jgi:hypothetical protein
MTVADDFSDDPRPHWRDAEVYPHHKPQNVKLTNRFVGFSGTSTAAKLSAATEKAKAMNEAQIVKTIKAHIAKGDQLKDKSKQHYISAGQHLETLKKDGAHKRNGLTWEQYVKDKCGIGRERADQLIRTADGRTTVEQERANTAQRVMKHSKKPVLANTGQALTVVDAEAAADHTSDDPRLEKSFRERLAKGDQIQHFITVLPRLATPDEAVTLVRSWDEYVRGHVRQDYEPIEERARVAHEWLTHFLRALNSQRAVERALTPPAPPPTATPPQPQSPAERWPDYADLPPEWDRRSKRSTVQ